jgi:hypothetical protein
MTKTITRKRFLARTVGGAAGAASVAGVLPSTVRAATTLDGSFTAPYPPNPVVAYPTTSWSIYTALIPSVVLPYDVIACNRTLGPLPDIQGFPDLSAVPSDATMLLLYLQEPVPVADVPTSFPQVSEASELTGSNVQFTDLGGGQTNWQGFRNFVGWYVATLGQELYSIGVNVYVGPNAGAEWSEVQPIVDSIHLSS